MATRISELRMDQRVLLQDLGTYPRFADASLDAAVRTVIRMGKLPGYTLTPDLAYVTPDLSDPNKFALLLYHVALLFTRPDTGNYSYRTRAMSETFGSLARFVDDLAHEIWALENGTAYANWQMFAGWYEAHFGVNFWQNYTRVNVDAPFQTITYNRNGTTSDSNNRPTDMDQVIPFNRADPALTADYLLGEYVAPHLCAVTTVLVNCNAGAGDTVLGLEINGTVVSNVPIAAGETRVTLDLSSAEVKLSAGHSVKWKVVSAPAAPEECISQVALGMTVSIRYPG